MKGMFVLRKKRYIAALRGAASLPPIAAHEHDAARQNARESRRRCAMSPRSAVRDAAVDARQAAQQRAPARGSHKTRPLMPSRRYGAMFAR